MDAASIEQMNKVRASVGLPPLPVPGRPAGGLQFQEAEAEDSGEDEDDLSTLDKRQAAADGNWQKLENERLEKLEREKRKDAAKKARDAAARYAKLDGKGLGDADDGGDLDTRSWLLQQKKRQKKIEQARKLEAELAEREREMQAAYTSKDLAGVKVGHEIEDFDELTGEKILTLKDTQIGEESEEDELENQDLRAQERLQQRMNLKKKRPNYDPTEEGEEKAVLSKYDEEIDGRKQKRFKLDGQGTSSEARKQRIATETAAKPGRGVKISLDMLEDTIPVTDYLDAASIKIKKPKKSKEKKTRQKAGDEDDIIPVQSTNADMMDLDTGDKTTKKRVLDFDDDDLQSKLAQQRRDALKKRKKLDAGEVARQMREEMVVDDDQLEEGGLLIDETSEFVANLKKPDVADAIQPAQQEATHSRTPESDRDADGDHAMEESYAAVEDADADARAAQPSTATANGLEAEETMGGQGLGSAVALLRKRGLVKDGDSGSIADKERLRQRFLSEKQKLIEDFDTRAKEQREIDSNSGRLDKMSHRERDLYAKQQNDAREHYLARLQAEMFNADYKPEVNLEYYDEYGHSMNQKEAFKHLSHSFHGKASGKQKTEKRLKKIADERKSMSKGVLNASEESGMSFIQGREGKRTKQAGVRLQ